MRGTPRGDDGFVLALAAIVMVTLMAFSALAVDLGGLYNERRQDQSAADMAALAGVRELPDATSAAQEAIVYAEATLGLPAGTLDFDSCAGDPGALANPIAGYNCVSVDQLSSRLRVRLPDQQYNTFFASVVGLDAFTHSAFAEAEVIGAGFGQILPFSISSGGGYTCPGTPPAGLATAPCSGPASGNFGYLNLSFFQEPKSCTQGGGSNRFGQNLAMGADHIIARWTGADRREFDLCPTGIGPAGPPNVMRTETGNIAGSVAEGMLRGPGNPAVTYRDGERGRLTRFNPLLFAGGGAPAPSASTTAGSVEVDDNPLWNFIPVGLTGDVPPSCRRSVFVDSSGAPRANLSGLEPNFIEAGERDTFNVAIANSLASVTDAERMIALLDRCFTHYQGQGWGAAYGVTPEEPSPCGPAGCTDPVFSVNSSNDDAPDLWDLQYTSRFGYAPLFASGCDLNGTGECRIERFRAMFIQQICTGSGTGNCTAFDPGFGQTLGSLPNSIAGVTVWMFPDRMLPGGLGEQDAPSAFGVNRFTVLVR